uniref:Uncharacterized protein n=1 Tax=uncultured Armatimonadetes bacterium TaxID=157466 RepID=A0A6J4JYW0_9BACT|nr:hypothetical protein AVDCRST_MAG63-4344 [uncultured Armatimonadetes bacterium]
MSIQQKTTIANPGGPITFGEFEANRAPQGRDGRRAG